MRKRILALALSLGGMIAASGCINPAAEVLDRIPSGDGRVDALILRTDVAPSGNDVHYVQIVPKGDPPNPRKHDLFRADNVTNFRVAWVSDRVLDIEFGRARIFHFSNFWMSREIDSFGYVVEVRLRPRHRRAVIQPQPDGESAQEDPN